MINDWVQMATSFGKIVVSPFFVSRDHTTISEWNMCQRRRNGEWKFAWRELVDELLHAGVYLVSSMVLCARTRICFIFLLFSISPFSSTEIHFLFFSSCLFISPLFYSLSLSVLLTLTSEEVWLIKSSCILYISWYVIWSYFNLF